MDDMSVEGGVTSTIAWFMSSWKLAGGRVTHQSFSPTNPAMYGANTFASLSKAADETDSRL